MSNIFIFRCIVIRINRLLIVLQLEIAHEIHKDEKIFNVLFFYIHSLRRVSLKIFVKL